MGKHTNIDNLPLYLKENGLFCLWKYEEKNGRKTKVPYNPNRPQYGAKSNDRSTFADIKTAAAKANGFDGLGIGVFDSIAGIDIDHCHRVTDGKLSEMAKEIVETMDTYTEISPSGTGLRILFLAPGFSYDTEKYYIKHDNLEVYIPGMTNRYLTVTGNTIRNMDLTDRSDRLNQILDKYMKRRQKTAPAKPAAPSTPLTLSDNELIAKASEAKNGAKFNALWNGDISGYTSQSEADQALCNILAFWTGEDAARIDSLFRQSGLMRNKWDERRSGSTYGAETIRKAIENCSEVYEPNQKIQPTKVIHIRDTSDSLTKPDDFTDVGNAEVVVRRNRSKMYFCDALGWMVYNDSVGCWEPSEHAARGKCIEFTDAMLDQAKKEINAANKKAYDKHQEDLKKAMEESEKTGEKVSEADLTKKIKSPPVDSFAVKFYTHALRSRGRHAIDNMLSLCKPDMHIKAKEFDSNPYDLNTPAGIVDLRTGKIRPHDPSALCTHITTCSPGDDGKALWDDFLNLITCGDADLIKYLQLNAGMSAVGKVTSEYAVFAIGNGRNGKSTYYGALSAVLGDYAGAIDSEALIADNRDKRFAFSGIRGKRFVTCGELEENKKLSTKALKEISSATDKFLIEQKHKDREEVPRTFHLTLFSNFKPKVNATDNGTWRRIVVVPFNAVMPSGDKEIKDYAGYLADHAGGAILKWIIDGAVQLYKANFNLEAPAAVSTASIQYREAESWINNFLEDCFYQNGGQARAGDVQRLWGIYSRMNNLPPRSRAEVIEALREKGFEQRPIGGNKIVWAGITINEEMQALLNKG